MWFDIVSKILLSCLNVWVFRWFAKRSSRQIRQELLATLEARLSVGQSLTGHSAEPPIE